MMPPVEAGSYYLPGTIPFRQVSPESPCLIYPKEAVDDGAMVFTWSPRVGLRAAEAVAVAAPIVRLLAHVCVVLDPYLLAYQTLQTDPSFWRVMRYQFLRFVQRLAHARSQ